MRTTLLALLAVACASTGGDVYEVCSLDATLEPTTGLVGDTITVTGGPFSDEGIRDTRVEVGGVRATVVAVTRDGCEECDACRDEAGCPPCGLCNGRLLEDAERVRCFGDPLASPAVEGECATCAQSMTFEIPAGAPIGTTAVWIVTRDGSSEPIPFVVTGGTPSTGETGGAHTGETGGTTTSP